MAKPIKFPRWASDDIVDPTSGVNNVVEPSEAKKDLGHGPKGEFPPRQYQNWFMRLVYEWIVWLEEQVTGVLPVQTGIFSAKVTTIDFVAEHTFDIHWQKNGDIVSILFPVLFQAAQTGTRIRIQPDGGAGNWPPELLPPAGNQIKQSFICYVDSGGSIVLGSGYIEIAPGATSNWDLGAPDVNGNLADTNFTSTNNKGWAHQTITYSTKDMTP